MQWDALAYALVGGLLGSLLGVWASFRIERQRAGREQRAAGRAVALELMTNVGYLEAALKGAPLTPLRREMFDRELKGLAMLLDADAFRTVTGAYIKFAAVADRLEGMRAISGPEDREVVDGMRADCAEAAQAIAERVWTIDERARMSKPRGR